MSEIIRSFAEMMTAERGASPNTVAAYYPLIIYADVRFVNFESAAEVREEAGSVTVEICWNFIRRRVCLRRKMRNLN